MRLLAIWKRYCESHSSSDVIIYTVALLVVYWAAHSCPRARSKLATAIDHTPPSLAYSISFLILQTTTVWFGPTDQNSGGSCTCLVCIHSFGPTVFQCLCAKMHPPLFRATKLGDKTGTPVALALHSFTHLHVFTCSVQTFSADSWHRPCGSAQPIKIAAYA